MLSVPVCSSGRAHKSSGHDAAGSRRLPLRSCPTHQNRIDRHVWPLTIWFVARVVRGQFDRPERIAVPAPGVAEFCPITPSVGDWSSAVVSVGRPRPFRHEARDARRQPSIHALPAPIRVEQDIRLQAAAPLSRALRGEDNQRENPS